MNERVSSPRRRQEILQRARQRQAMIRQREEGDEPFLPLVDTTPSPKDQHDLLPIPPEPPTSPPPVETPLPPAPYTQELSATPPSEFDLQHNAVRLYIVQQFEEGKTSREIAAVIGLTPHRITRWYNQVKNLPSVAYLWTPLLSEADIKPTTEATVPEPEPTPVPVERPQQRRLEPTREALQAARKALKQAEKTVRLQDDHAFVQDRVAALTAKGSTLEAAQQATTRECDSEEWGVSRIARALGTDATSVAEWLTGPADEAPRRSAMAERSMRFLVELYDRLPMDPPGELALVTTNAVERERALAALSMLGFTPKRSPRQGGRAIVLAEEDADELRLQLAAEP